MSLVHRRQTCRLCLSSQLDVVAPLAGMPAATPNAGRTDPTLDAEAARSNIPLDLYLCKSCGHLQLLHVVDPVYIYRKYTYRTSLSLGLTEHFKQSARRLMDELSLPSGARVVDVGSNDGTLLRAFRHFGCEVLGIDPATAIAEAATAAGTETWARFFDRACAAEIVARFGKVDLLLANNVIANIDEMGEFADAVFDVLKDDGVFVFQTQYGRDVIEKILIDTIYHEHLSYFNIKPLKSFFAAHGLSVIDVSRIATKGGSIMVKVQKAATGQRPTQPIVEQLIREEEDGGYYALERYHRFIFELNQLREALTVKIDAILAAGGTVAGYGVSVGSVALLPQFDLIGKLSYLFDDDPEKTGVLDGPGYSIPVEGTQDLAARNPTAVVLLAWRYAESIIERQQSYKEKGGYFLTLLPSVREIH